MTCLKTLHFRFLLLFAAVVCVAGTARAQGGSCHDPWINQNYNTLYHRAPSGSGVTGECNPAMYGGGHWTSYGDLTNKIIAVRGRPTAVQAAPVAAATGCHDPWINQAYTIVMLRPASGSGVSGECNPALYGGGQWSSLNDLEKKVVAYHTPQPAPSTLQLGHLPLGTGQTSGTAPLTVLPLSSTMNTAKPPLVLPPGSYHVDKNGNLANSAGIVVMTRGTFYTTATGNIVAQGGGNIVAQGGGNIVAQGGGNITGQNQ
jgi:hypothetical protein